MTIKTIYTLDGRDNMYLDTMKDWFNLDENTLHEEINGTFQECLSVLEEMKIKYDDLKNGLIPKSDKKEIAFVFDINKIESSSYGYDIFTKLIPLFDKKSCNSVLCGDFLGDDRLKHKLQSAFFQHLQKAREVDYQHHDQFFIVYLNNLPDQYLKTINDGLSKFIPYVGFFDLTYSSFLKTYLSTILTRHFLKTKATIITPNEVNGAINIYGYPFERNGFKCKGFDTIHYGLFLSYKIEREVFEGFESDTTFSINAITNSVLDISNFEIHIEKDKLEYLLKNKTDNIVRGGIANLTIQELEQLIKNKINNNYIYNLRLKQNEEKSCILFNILVELKRVDKDKPMKLLVGLEYLPAIKTLKVTTAY